MNRYALLLTMLLLLATTAYAQGCQVFSPHGFLPDTDCDGVHDEIDNCPVIPNAQQFDSNRNGAGDACDLIIEEVTIEPSSLAKAGQYATIDLLLLNNRPFPIDHVSVRAKDLELALNLATDIPTIRSGAAEEMELRFKIPECQREGTSTLSVTVEYLLEGQLHEEQRNILFRVVPGGSCGAITPMKNTIIETFNEQELQPGERIILPVRITNLNDDQVTYKISAYGLGDWGTYRVDPEAEFVLAPGHDLTSYVAIETEEFAPLGKHEFFLRIQAGDETEDSKVALTIYKTATLPEDRSLQRALELALIAILVLLLLFGIVLAAAILLRRSAERAIAREEGRRPAVTAAPKRRVVRPKRAIETVDEQRRSNF